MRQRIKNAVSLLQSKICHVHTESRRKNRALYSFETQENNMMQLRLLGSLTMNSTGSFPLDLQMEPVPISTSLMKLEYHQKTYGVASPYTGKHGN